MSLDPYAYDDFRQLLAEYWKEMKDREPGLTTRAFAARAGFTNPGFLGDVVKGRRTLSVAALEKMVRAFGLKPKEAEYFRLLVRFGQARPGVDRDTAHRQLLFRRNRSSFTRLHPALSRYYQDPRYPLVRAALQCMDYRGDSAALGEWMDPPMAPGAVARVVGDLVDWGLVQVDRDGRHRVVDTFVEPPPHLGGLVRELNRTWIDQAGDALHRLPPRKRHMSTILLTVGQETQVLVQQRIDKFREEIFELLKADRSPDRMMQLSIQFFPRCRSGEVA